MPRTVMQIIYAEVYDGNYSDIIDYYSQYGNFTYYVISGSLSVGFYYSCNPLLANMRYYLLSYSRIDDYKENRLC